MIEMIKSKILAKRAPDFPLLGGEVNYLSFSPKRSGQHVVFDWIGRNCPTLFHVNNCYVQRERVRYRVFPKTFRTIMWRDGSSIDSGVGNPQSFESDMSRNAPFSRVLYSFEDLLPVDELSKNLPSHTSAKIIVILRDVYNWLASSMFHSGSGRERLHKRLILHKEICQYVLSRSEEDVVFISYNDFISSAEYRERLAGKLGIVDLRNNQIERIPDFGGGSSFDQLKLPNSVGNESPFLNRWRSLAGNAFAIELLDSNLVRTLNLELFNVDFMDEIKNGKVSNGC